MRRHVPWALLSAAVGASLLLGAFRAAAGDEGGGQPHADRLTGTLKAVRDRGSIRLGHRVNSFPFAFLSPRGRPLGYSLDLCAAVVEEVSAELGREIRVEYLPVTPENRFDLLQSGAIDLECGSTSGSVERRKRFAFSPTIFVTGTKLLVRRDWGAQSLDDLRGRKVAVTRGTTNEAAVEKLSAKRMLGIALVKGADHDESFRYLESGAADAFAADDVLLHSRIAKTAGNRYRVVGDYLSFDPYALVYRKDDPDFADVVDRAFRRLAESREIVGIYGKWFLERLPSGERLGLPMGPQLEELFRAIGLPGDGS
jgi:glutamate/aspartate transport system substrate-binding protein